MEFRHLWKSKWIIILVIMLIFNGILFGSRGIINQYDKKEYIDDYVKYIEYTVDSADIMSGISIFAKQNSYSSKNIDRTKNAFAECKNIKLEETNDTALEQVMSWKLRYIFVLILLIMAAEELLVERKNGLWEVTYAETIHRKRAEVKRILALLVTSYLVQLLFTGIELVIAFVKYGGIGDMSTAVQTSILFKHFPYIMNKWEFLAIYFIIAGAGTFIIALFILMAFSIFKERLLSYILVIVVGMAELLCKYLIPEHSVMNILKYVNAATVFMPEDYYTYYANWGMGSFIINRNILMLLVSVLTVIILIAVLLWNREVKRPCSGGGKLERWAVSIMRGFHQWIAGRSIRGKECYKIYILRAGIIFIIAAGIMSIYNSKIDNKSYTVGESMYEEYCRKHFGDVDDDAQREREDIRNRLNAMDEQYNAIREQRDNADKDSSGDNDGSNSISDEDYAMYITLIEGSQSLREELQYIDENMAYLDNLSAKHGIDGKIIVQRGYEELFGEKMEKTERFGILFMFVVIVLVMHRNYSEDIENQMYSLYRSIVDGCKQVYRVRTKVEIGYITLMYLLFYGIKLGIVTYSYGLNGLSYPVQSIMMLLDVKLHISIGVYLAIFLIIRYLIILSAYEIVKCASIVLNNNWKSFFVSGVILIIMSAIDVLKYYPVIIIPGIIAAVLSRISWKKIR